MTIEELTKYVETPLERVSQPNEKAMNDKCEAIDKEISGCFARMEELKIERQMISEGFRIERAARMEDMAARKALLERRNELTAEFSTGKSKASALRSELSQIREQISNLPHVQSGELEAKIMEAEEKIETESMSIKQERELNTKIKGWRDQLRQAKTVEPLLARRKVLEEELKLLQTSMDELKGKLNAVYEKLGAKKEKKEEKKEGEEEKKEREDPYQKINDEWKELQAKIDAKRQEKREVRNAYFEQRRQYNEFSSKNRRMRVARSVLERKQREAAELEQQRKEEEEMLKRHPFEKEMAVCDDLLVYLKGLQTKTTATPAAAKPAFQVPEGMTLLKREEEVLYAEEPKKKKKDRRERKQKKTAFTHDLGTLQSFAMVHLKAPVSEEEVQATVELVKARKAFFDALPRGADVVAELAKL